MQEDERFVLTCGICRRYADPFVASTALGAARIHSEFNERHVACIDWNAENWGRELWGVYHEKEPPSGYAAEFSALELLALAGRG